MGDVLRSNFCGQFVKNICWSQLDVGRFPWTFLQDDGTTPKRPIHISSMDNLHKEREVQVIIVVSLDKLLNRQSCWLRAVTPWRLYDVTVIPKDPISE